MQWGWVMLAALGVSGCSPSFASLVVDVRTDFVPDVEFVEVAVTVEDGPWVTYTVRGDDTGFEGFRVAELATIEPGLRRLRVALIDRDTNVVAERVMLVDLQGPSAVTALIASACRDVTCAEGEACVAGRCQPEACSDLAPDACAAADCSADLDCGAPIDCRTPRCVEDGRCLVELAPASCDAPRYCSAELGCSATTLSVPELVVLDGPSIDEDDPSLTPDGLELIFNRTSAPGAGTRLFSVRRPTPDGEWGLPVELSITGAVGGGSSRLSHDGLSLYFSVRELDELRVAQRTSLDAPFEDSILVPGLESEGRMYLVGINGDQTRAIVTAREGIGGFRFFETQRASAADDWDAPTIIESLRDMRVRQGDVGFLSPDGRVLFAARMVTDDDNEVFFIERSDIDSPFGPPVPLRGLMTVPLPSDFWLEPDGRTVWLSVDDEGEKRLFRTSF